jgi:RNA recognition motif-containing protein
VEWAANLDRGSVELDSKSIFVGQLNQGLITQRLLEERFAVYGEIENIQLVNKYPSGPSKYALFSFGRFLTSQINWWLMVICISLGSRPGFAFIQFADPQSAEKAIEEEVSFCPTLKHHVLEPSIHIICASSSLH